VKGYGSGFVIAPGYIVTNAHVVARAAEVRVVFSDGFISEAEVLAIDPSRDLALLRTIEHGVPIKLGDSDRVGRLVK